MVVGNVNLPKNDIISWEKEGALDPLNFKLYFAKYFLTKENIEGQCSSYITQAQQQMNSMINTVDPVTFVQQQMDPQFAQPGQTQGLSKFSITFFINGCTYCG